ncbi:MAG: MerR family transcriptional regulator [Lachnospiraceae bacterium]|jgi:DNA-binding transcriptional MerR regulator
MEEEYLSIGKMAEINGISIQTLRLYDRLGLLSPAYVNPQTGYRYYTLMQNARLDMIAYMKELGMSLSEIRETLQQENVERLESLLGKKNEQLFDQIRQIRERQRAVARAISSMERYRKSPTTGTIALEYIDQRYMWSIPCPVNFYATDKSGYEKDLVKLRKALLEAKVPQLHTYNVGTSIRLENFEHGNFTADRIFILSDKHLKEYPGQVDEIESGMYACIYLDNYDNEMEGAKKLAAFCREKGYLPAGDYICEVLTEFVVFDNQNRGMFMRLQIPIKFSQIH